MSLDRVISGETAAGQRPCWSCQAPLSVRAAFCHACGRIQPPAALDHFRRLNLAPRFDLPTADLEQQYFGLQRSLHPDRFAGKSSREKALSLQHATALNEAYDVLRQPLRRGEYLLELRGRPLNGADGGTIDDEELLTQAMAMRERLADAAGEAEVLALIASAEADAAAILAEIEGAFAQEDLASAARLLTRLRYLAKLTAEARARVAGAGSGVQA